METNFYEEIAHKIYTYQTQIGVTNFDLLEYIEERHKTAPFKGSTFYSNLIHALPNHFGAKMFPDKFKEVLLYCKSKIDNKMLLGDYAKIILRGLYNSPNFLVEHLKRELTKVEAQGFTKAEFEFDLRETITIMKNSINELYETDLKKYEKYEEEDKSLPKANKNYYPKPDKNAISITNFKLPEGTAFYLPKPIFLNDLEKVENALNELKPEDKKKPVKNGSSLKQIAIAYKVMNIFIDEKNAGEIISKHSNYSSTEKLLQKRVNKLADLTKLTGNKTTDTKHLKDLEAAKRLISGMKKRNAIQDISRIITAFTTAYKSQY